MPLLKIRRSSGVQLSEPVWDRQTVHTIRYHVAASRPPPPANTNTFTHKGQREGKQPAHTCPDKQWCRCLHPGFNNMPQTHSPSFPLTHSHTLPSNPLCQPISQSNPSPPLNSTPQLLLFITETGSMAWNASAGGDGVPGPHAIRINSRHPGKKKKGERKGKCVWRWEGLTRVVVISQGVRFGKDGFF